MTKLRVGRMSCLIQGHSGNQSNDTVQFPQIFFTLTHINSSRVATQNRKIHLSFLAASTAFKIFHIAERERNVYNLYYVSLFYPL